jgi:hypothetical protein
MLDEAFGARNMAAPSVEDLFDGDRILIPGHPAFGTSKRAFHFQPERLPERPPADGRQAEPPLVLSYMSFMAQPLGTEVVRGILGTGSRAVLVDGNDYGLPEEMARDPTVFLLGELLIDLFLGQERCGSSIHSIIRKCRRCWSNNVWGNELITHARKFGCDISIC